MPALFPASSPLVLKPGAGAFAPHAERFSRGHVARWFSATDGQEGDRPFAEAHALCSLAEALEVMRIGDDLRSQPDGYWVEPHWLAIASDGAGQHLMIDDHDGRVLAVAHDDDHVQVVAPSAEVWLALLLEGHAKGYLVWDETFGLIDAESLAGIHAAQRAQAERQRARPVPWRHRLGLGTTIGLMLLLSGLFVWVLVTHR
jgi:hypothetical protein